MSRYFFDITGMASSSVSQEDFDIDFQLTSRRSRIRTARARIGPPRITDTSSINFQKNTPNVEESQGVCETSTNSAPEHENQQNKPVMRKQDKRVTGRVLSVVPCLHRPTHMNKGKQQRDRRKLREKRRSTGVVHLPSTEERTAKIFTQRRNKSHSDFEADDEEFDSLNQSDSVNQSDHGNHEPQQTSVNTGNTPRLPTPTGDSPHELIERAQEENRRLLSLLEDRDHKIMTLQGRLLQQQHEMTLERERLREENAALIRAMAALASN
ncbi:PREDICTED: PRKC apoptosis WT1 regulator protein-like isoform X5 [Dufourea novaeangliae]|uniref:PRKC apoptosis WT1 regulator protein-like isoform X5 n=1 Tax=Dufourea novaeangliae TaxID=178035 RepID=UPI000767A4D1|nr:PREDICTED: PRKC apoptosis WT1 regulator protein-like isoform X5 [Dufourea novaeangliae]